MQNIDPTSDDVAALYQRMTSALSQIRQRVDRPLGVAEKILLSHLDDGSRARAIRGEDYVQLRPDRVLLQDVLAQTALLQFMQTGRPRTLVPTTIHCDHLIEARTGAQADLPLSIRENEEVFAFLRTAAAKYGIGFWEPGAGIIHQVALENYALPGALIIGTDSHTPMAGGLGAAAVGVGGADAVEVMAGMTWELLYPKLIGVHLTGQLSGWASPKDVILRLADELKVTGATNAIIEYFGDGTRAISATGKATITNMGAELGATTSIFPYDERMATYLAASGRTRIAEVAEVYAGMLTADSEVVASPQEYFDRVVTIDLSQLEPHVAGPHSPDRVRPISRLAEEVGHDRSELVDSIATALIGSCTNSSYEDMCRAASIASQAAAHDVAACVPLMVTPGSESVRATIERDGQLASLEAIGAAVLANACGPCIGQWHRDTTEAAVPNTILTSYNRNFPGRNDGQRSTMNFIASPEIVTAMALAGRLSFNPLTDDLVGKDGRRFRLQAPPAAPEVPTSGFSTDRSAYIEPPDDGTFIEVAIDPHSERLQRLPTWPAWDGQDFFDLPVLGKARGKTTTDDIAPAGPWLRYRGHLERFSDATFLRVANAFSQERGTGVNVLTGNRGENLAVIARRYRAEGLKWIVVGDWNYGEGSSREHAALAPRLLGCAAIIARGFARIHETNLKKQGILTLTFTDPLDYDRIGAEDRVSIVGLRGIAVGHPVMCLIHKTDGTTERLQLRHSYTESQLDWFRAGSALNAAANVATLDAHIE